MDNAALQGAVAIDRAPAYTEPTAEQILLNQPDARFRDLLRRHGDSSPDMGSSDILYRMATFEISESLEQIEPDGHLPAGATDRGKQSAAAEAGEEAGSQ